MTKKLVVFASGGFELAGFWDMPERDGPCPGVLCCHGFTGHHVEARRLYSRLARMLADRGVAVFRFDHRGCGDSSGDFIDFTPKGLLEDLQAATRQFIAEPRLDQQRLAVVGYSLGGLAASYVLSRNPQLWQTAVFWAGVARPEIIRDRLAQYPAFQGYRERGYMDYGGFRISAAYIDEIGTLTAPVEWAKQFPGPILFCHGEDDDIVRLEQSHLFLSARSNAGDRLKVFAGADHGFSSCDTLDDLLKTTVGWLAEKLGVANS
ncbi:MAG: alpha/beta hydrolase family protein [Candidatus Sumerlaeaceae bacterium]